MINAVGIRPQNVMKSIIDQVRGGVSWESDVNVHLQYVHIMFAEHVRDKLSKYGLMYKQRLKDGDRVLELKVWVWGV